MFIVDKTPYKYLVQALTAGQEFKIDPKWVYNKVEGGATQILLVVDGDTTAQVNYRVDPVVNENASNGFPIFQYGTLELKNGQAIRDLRFYCVATATLRIILMR